MDSLLPYISNALMLIVGLFCYVFSRSVSWIKDEKKREKWELFRKENGRILRLGGLLLAAISLVNLFLDIKAA